MKVLHFYKTSVADSMGGVEQVIDHIGRGASRHGIQTDVLALSTAACPPVMELHGYTVHRAKLDAEFASTGISLSVFRRFAELARHADLIHYHFPWPFMDLVHFAVLPDKPCIVTYHSDIIRQKYLLQLYKPLRDRFLASVDRIIATSPNYFATSSVLSQFADKVDVIPIGLDRNSYPEPDPACLLRWSQRFGPRFFLFVGVLRYYKGLHILIEAARNSAYPIVIAGAGPIEAELREQVALTRADNIHFIGFINDEDKVALLKLCTAVLFPSHLRSEAFGISLLEGAMYGKPMISSEIGTGTTYINIADETGLVVPPGDPAALRAAMDWMWTHPEEASVMGQRAEARYWEHFTADRMVESYAKVYRQLLQPKKPRIAVVANSSWSLQNFRLGLLRTLDQRGFDVVTVAPLTSGRAALKDAGCRMIDLNMSARGTNPLEDFALMLRMVRLYRRLKPALIIHYTIKPNIYGTLAARICGIPSLAVTTGLGYTFISSGTVPWIARQLYRLALRYPREVWFLNRDDWREFIARGLVAEERASVLDSEGVDIEHFAPRPRNSEGTPVTFLLLARMLWAKGVGEFVAAARQLRSEGLAVRFQLLGPCAVANPSAITREQMARWEQEGVIEYLGESTDVRGHVAAADCVVLPSAYGEGVPRTLMEAAAMGLPVITTDIPGCREVVLPGESGLLVPPNDAAALAHAMKRLASMAPDTRTAMGARGRTYVLERFDEQKIITRYLDFIARQGLTAQPQ